MSWTSGIADAFKIITIMAIFLDMSSDPSYPYNPAEEPGNSQNSFQPQNGKIEQGSHELLSKFLVAAGALLLSALVVVIILKILE